MTDTTPPEVRPSPATDPTPTSRRRLGRSAWHHHPAVRSGDQLTVGERAADLTRNGLGSWTFVFCALTFLAAWMAYNRSTGFDKYPFILLNLVLSCLAAMQGAILLIAAKRADQIAAALSMHTYDNTQAASGLLNEHRSLLERNTELTEQVHELVDHTLALAERIDRLTDEIHQHICTST